jgi:hypothetical protein
MLVPGNMIWLERKFAGYEGKLQELTPLNQRNFRKQLGRNPTRLIILELHNSFVSLLL